MGAIGLLSACAEAKPEFKSVDITGADYAKNFQLTDHNGQPRSLKDFQGKVVALFFGYTQCPDVCPTTLAELAEVKKALGADGSKLQGVFVTVDPERDTPERFAQYVRHFHPDFLGATGSDDILKAVTRDLGALYARVNDPQSALGYTMDHSASIYLINPQGQLAAIFSAPHDPALIAQDFMALVHTAGPQT